MALLVGGVSAQDIIIDWRESAPAQVVAPAQLIIPAPAVARAPSAAPTPSAAPGKIKTISFTKPAVPVRNVVTPVFQAQAQPRPKGGPILPESQIEFQVRTDLPTPDILFRRDSEAQVLERIRQESARPGGQRIIFPEKVPVSKEPYVPRDFPQTASVVEHGHIAHRRLFFEQKNFDRQLWEVGYLQPGISGFRFFYDTVMMPYHCGTDVLRRWDSSAGKCLPGDDTPLYCYREPFSVTGLTFQVFAVAGGILIFP